MIFHGSKTVTTAGTAVRLCDVSVPCASITVFPKKTNTGEVRIGGDLLNNTTGVCTKATTVATGTGLPLAVGDASVVFSNGGLNCHNLNQVILDADVNGEGVQFIYEVI